jgi:curved DNA-binding protein
MLDYYNILGVSPEASQDDIKKAYRNLVKQHHPDKGGDEDRFKQISEAYEILGDSSKRQDYDYKKNASSNSSFEEFFSRFNGDFSNMFNNAYGHSARGMDVRLTMNIDILEVYHGTSKNVNIGFEDFNVRIPRGIRNGAQMKMTGKGQPHPVNTSAPRGDIIITIQYTYNPNIIVNGDDIWIDLTVDPLDLLTGTSMKVETPIHNLTVKVPKNSYEGKTLRISGKGMPIYNSIEYGNLMIKLRTHIPKLTDQQLQLIKNAKQLSTQDVK